MRIHAGHLNLMINSYQGETDQVQGCSSIPQVWFKNSQFRDPSRPEHGTDDHKRQERIYREKDPRFMENMPGLGDYAEFERGRLVKKVKCWSPDIHHEIG